ncbi:ABC transporter permease [Marinobacterium sp. D7]|uniref:ABC transporter permease subunit n=1 Tax=Marinobacterium ramblicola TaxID=2849041 RepID=UPI001C2CCC8B|nr:ABC transporter permease subunit [Marinobacterium ramblicola]MBV1790321.1 ABC transporter permease [Marinobacterium ramblicola]
MSIILAVCQKELKDGLRNRWLLGVSLIFALLAVGLAYFGAAASGRVGFTSLSTTVVSLASLAVFIIPLIALMLAYDSLVGEEENGTLLLLLSYPLARWQLLLGKLMGHGTLLALATLLGFGAAAVILGLLNDSVSWAELLPAFGLFILSAILLGWIFIAFSYLISTSVQEKSKAAGLALVLWFLFVLAFDLGLLGLLVATEGDLDAQLFPYLLLLNPTDIFRLIHISYFAEEQLSGLMAIAQHVRLGTVALFAALVFWLVVPVLLALWRFNRRKI